MDLVLLQLFGRESIGSLSCFNPYFNGSSTSTQKISEALGERAQFQSLF